VSTYSTPSTANRGDGAIGVAVDTLANLKNAAAKSLEGLRASRMSPELRSNSACPISPGKGRKRPQSRRLDPTRPAGLIRRSSLVHGELVVFYNSRCQAQSLTPSHKTIHDALFAGRFKPDGQLLPSTATTLPCEFLVKHAAPTSKVTRCRSIWRSVRLR